jgi:hypothetical protein
MSFSAANPLEDAEIEIQAHGGPIRVTGLAQGSTAELNPGRGMEIPAHKREMVKEIYVPPPPDKPITAARYEGQPLQALDEDAIDLLPRGEPIVYDLSNADNFDLHHFEAPAAQAARHARRLVIVAHAAKHG